MARTKTIVEVAVPGGKLAVARWRGEGLPLLLVHGISGSHHAWSRVVEHPALASFDIIAPDLRGRCGSRDAAGPYGLPRHVEDLCAVLDACNVTRACYAGHSLGAYIGVHFGVRAAERLAGLVLVDGGLALPLPAGLEPAVLLEKVLGPALARLSRTFESREAYRDFWRDHPAFQDAGAWNAEVEAYFDYDLGGEAPALKSRVLEAAVREDGLGPMAPEMITLIDRITAPMLLVTAVRGLLNQPEPLMPVTAVRAKVAAMPNLEWLEIPDTNHYSITLGVGAAPLAEALAAFAVRHA